MSQHARPYFEIANPEIPAILTGLPRGLRVLDVGCGSGVHGAELKTIHGHCVTGVDLSESSIDKAQHRLAEAHVADVTRPEDYPFYGRRQFDVLVFSDILEHLTDPLDVLSRHVPLVGPGGHVVISIPNIAIWNVRFSLLLGSFNYTDTGTLDRTHMRFFTRRTVRELVHDAGLETKRTRVSPGILRPFVPLVKKLYGSRGPADGQQADSSSIMDSGPYQLYMKRFYAAERIVCGLWPGMLAFQFVTLNQVRPQESNR